MFINSYTENPIKPHLQEFWIITTTMGSKKYSIYVEKHRAPSKAHALNMINGNYEGMEYLDCANEKINENDNGSNG